MSDMPHTLKVVTVWLVAGLLVFLGFQAWERRQQQARFQAQGDVIEIRRGADGHYHWPGRINGRAVDFLIDTGATGTAMSQALATQLGLKVIGQVQSHTAGGTVDASVVQANLSLNGGVKVERMHIAALRGLDDEQPLLGMDVLSKLRWQQHQGVMSIDLRAPKTGLP
ncbi:MAG TPA: retropepsin-like aspartic protease [Rhizobacter sp.]|nr:retropepsin-like aspartic protease [Rhizobacter sp.]